MGPGGIGLRRLRETHEGGSWAARPRARPDRRCLFGGLGRLLLDLLAVAPVVPALELLDPAGGVHVLHLAGEERVAGRADLDGDVLSRAAGDELVAATAGHGRLFVL